MELTREKLYEIVTNAVKERVTQQARSGCQHYTREIGRYINTHDPELKTFEVSATEAPKTTDIIGFADPHAYLLVSDGKNGFIVDGSISQYITHFEDISEEVIGRRQSYFVGSREELKRIVQKAQQNTLKYLKESGESLGLEVDKITKLSDIDAKNSEDCELTNKIFPCKILKRDGSETQWNGFRYDTSDCIPVLKEDPNYSVIIHHQPSRLFESQWGTKSLIRVSRDFPQQEIEELKSVFNNEIAISRSRGHSPHEPNDFKKLWHKSARKSAFINAEYDRTGEKHTIPFR